METKIFLLSISFELNADKSICIKTPLNSFGVYFPPPPNYKPSGNLGSHRYTNHVETSAYIYGISKLPWQNCAWVDATAGSRDSTVENIDRVFTWFPLLSIANWLQESLSLQLGFYNMEWEGDKTALPVSAIKWRCGDRRGQFHQLILYNPPPPPHMAITLVSSRWQVVLLWWGETHITSANTVFIGQCESNLLGVCRGFHFRLKR